MKDQEKLNKLNQALEEIRPFLQKDGGDISLIDFTDKEVVIQFEGNCFSCKINDLTLNVGVKQIIKKYLPDIERVRNL
jgi:Fe-S cluster biogenesis protein NfuA